MDVTSWIIVFEFVCAPLSFVFCGPLFSKTPGRWTAIGWYCLIQAVVLIVLYATSPSYRFQSVLIAALIVLGGILGFAAAHFGWRLGPKTRRVFDSIAGFWIKVIEFFLRT